MAWCAALCVAAMHVHMCSLQRFLSLPSCFPPFFSRLPFLRPLPQLATMQQPLHWMFTSDLQKYAPECGASRCTDSLLLQWLLSPIHRYARFSVEAAHQHAIAQHSRQPRDKKATNLTGNVGVILIRLCDDCGVTAMQKNERGTDRRYNCIESLIRI